MDQFLTWREAWNTRIDWVDRDHQEMVKRFNDLARACERGPEPIGATSGRPYREHVLASLNALIEHNLRHFEAEEAFLREIGYPDYEAHCRDHVMQMAEFLVARQHLEQDLAEHLGAETLAEFKTWFFDHVIAEDHRYAEFYHRQYLPNPAEPEP